MGIRPIAEFWVEDLLKIARTAERHRTVAAVYDRRQYRNATSSAVIDRRYSKNFPAKTRLLDESAFPIGRAHTEVNPKRSM